MLVEEISLPGQPSFCTVTYEADRSRLDVTWQGALGAEEARYGAQQALVAVQQRHPLCVLNDNSRVKVMWFETLHWMEQHWAPAAAAHGVRYLAYITHPEVHATVVEVAMQYNFRPYFELQLFDNVDEGRE